VTTDSSRRAPAVAADRLGWGLLTFLMAGFALNHMAGTVVYAETDTDRLMFLALAAMNLYGLAVLLVPHRRGEAWAWAVTWVAVAVLALSAPYAGPPVGAFYLGAAVLMAGAQVVCSPFRTPEPA
jgi:hypothetical protein